MVSDNQTLQILVPLAGKSAFFPEDQYFFPKPLIEVGGLPMISRVIENLSTLARDRRFIFVVHRDDVARFSLDKTLQLLTDNNCDIVQLSKPTAGALCSALMAIDLLNPEAPLVIANGDQIIDGDLAGTLRRFQAREVDAGVITFESVHPRWSYVELADGVVRQAAEKRVISRSAIAGFYYFAAARSFTDAAMHAVRNGVSVDGEFFIAPCLNEVVLQNGVVAADAIEAARYHSFYSPDKIRVFEDEALKQTISGRARTGSDEVTIVIPAAGEGSRFRAAGYARPKPFIDVEGRPMIEHVIDNVAPARSNVHLLLRTEHLSDNADTVADLDRRGYVVHPVDKLTEGTACTLLLARKAFDNDRPLLVANSDQYVDFSVEDYIADCLRRDLDGSILVFRDPTRDPKWSFARLNDEGLVVEVAEKKAISDLATVGIYLFRRGDEFVSAAIDMIALNERVNNEFYTCPVYNYMIREGLRIGVYEVPQEAMSGLGTPADLDAYLQRAR